MFYSKYLLIYNLNQESGKPVTCETERKIKYLKNIHKGQGYQSFRFGLKYGGFKNDSYRKDIIFNNK